MKNSFVLFFVSLFLFACGNASQFRSKSQPVELPEQEDLLLGFGYCDGDSLRADVYIMPNRDPLTNDFGEYTVSLIPVSVDFDTQVLITIDAHYPDGSSINSIFDSFDLIPNQENSTIVEANIIDYAQTITVRSVDESVFIQCELPAINRLE